MNILVDRVNKRVLVGILTFILIFICTSLIIFWAQGYNINFASHTIESTGIISIQSKPSGADVYLNNKLKGQTPLSISNLIKGEYKVSVSKGDLSSWKSLVYIVPGQITYLYPVLFDSSFSLTKINTVDPILSSAFSPNNDLAVYETNSAGVTTLWSNFYNNSLINAGNSESEILSIDQNSILSGYSIDLNKSLFSIDNQKLLLYAKDTTGKINYLILQTSSLNTNIMNLSDMIDPSLYQEILWGPDNNTLLLVNPGEIISLNISTQQKVVLFQENTSNIPTNAYINGLFYIPIATNNMISIVGSDGTPQGNISLPLGSPVKSIVSNSIDQIAISTNSKTYIYDISTKTLLPITDLPSNLISFAPNAKDILFTDNSGEYYVYNQDENQIFDLHLNEDTVKDLYWHPFSDEILFSIENPDKATYTIEASDSTGQSITTLVKDSSTPYIGVLSSGSSIELEIDTSLYLVNVVDQSGFIF